MFIVQRQILFYPSIHLLPLCRVRLQGQHSQQKLHWIAFSIGPWTHYCTVGRWLNNRHECWEKKWRGGKKKHLLPRLLSYLENRAGASSSEIWSNSKLSRAGCASREGREWREGERGMEGHSWFSNRRLWKSVAAPYWESFCSTGGSAKSRSKYTGSDGRVREPLVVYQPLSQPLLYGSTDHPHGQKWREHLHVLPPSENVQLAPCMLHRFTFSTTL